MSRQVSRGSAGEYQADERAGVARVQFSSVAQSCPFPDYLPNPGIEPGSLALQADS